MADPELAAALARAAPFQGLDDAALARLVGIARLVRHDAGRVLFAEGDPARAFFVVRRGAVRLYRLSPDGRAQVLHHLRAGQSFAEAAVLVFGRYPAHAETSEPTELVEISGEPFMRLLGEDPGLVRAVLASLSQHLLRLVARVEELTTVTAAARLARRLLRLPARGAAGASEIELEGPKKDLAQELSIAPETLSRILRRWTERGILETRGRRIVLREPRILEAIADGLLADGAREGAG